MLKINISEWNSTPAKIFLGKVIELFISGYSPLANLRYRWLARVKFNLNPTGTKRTIGIS